MKKGFFNDQKISEIIEEYSPLVKRRLMRISGFDFYKDDLFQEGMIGLMRAAVSFDKDKGVPFDVYANICIDSKINGAIATYNKIGNKILTDADMLNEYIEADSADIQNNLESKMRLEAVFKKMENLSRNERESLILFLEGYSYQEIAQKLGSTIKSVENSLYRVRRKLR